MADEKKKLTSEQLKSDSERGKTKTDERDDEILSEDELDAVAGGHHGAQHCTGKNYKG